MSPLRYPEWKYAVGTGVGWLAYLFLNGIFRLPRAPLLGFLAMAAHLARRIGGESPATRAIDDLHFIISRGGESAVIVKRLITQSRSEEVVAIIRGATIRELP